MIIYRVYPTFTIFIGTRNSILYFLDQNQPQICIIAVSDLLINRKLL